MAILDFIVNRPGVSVAMQEPFHLKYLDILPSFG